MTGPIELYLVVPLDVDLLGTEDLSGVSQPIEVDGIQGFVCLPGFAGELGSPITAPSGFGRAAEDWGSWSVIGPDGSGQMTISALGFRFELPEAEPITESSDSSTESVIEASALRDAVIAWVDRFSDWAQVVVRQSLSALDPSPKVVSRRTSMPISWIVVDGQESSINSSPPVIVIRTEVVVSPLSERPADARSFARIVALANDEGLLPPVAVTFVTAGRVAAQRHRWRQAIVELGTGLEALLTDIRNLGVGHRRTLGPMVQDAIAGGVAISPIGGPAFVQSRNDAIHRGTSPAPSAVSDGLDMMDSLIATYYPSYACDSGLPLGHRPQRQGLRIVVPPSDKP